MSNLTQGQLPDVPTREIAIIGYLSEQPHGATAREIYEAVSQALEDTISRPAYYKILDRLVSAGKLEQHDEQGSRRYSLMPQLTAEFRLTLDDVYEMLPLLDSTTESMALAIEAQAYFLDHRESILRQTAQVLSEEPAVELFYLWLNDLITMLQADLASYRLEEADGPHLGRRMLADGALEHRLSRQCEEIRELLYRQLSIPFDAVDIPDWQGLDGLKRNGSIVYEPHKLKQALSLRVFGAGERQTVLGLVSVEQSVLDAAQEEMLISGSDGSFHAGTLDLRSAKGYIEDDSQILTFNNSVAYIRASEKVERQMRVKKFIYSAPLTRQTLDNPAYRGMVLAPFMYPDLAESEYEHMTRAATDVVQLRVDDDVFNGVARDALSHEQIMPPRVHIRDGTITPQERGFNHYSLSNAYGDITREGIARSRSILQRIRSSSPRATPQVYAGAVKSTQIRLFSRLINWYISKGSRLTRQRAIEPRWEKSHADYISDIDVMTILFASPSFAPTPNSFWMSCVVIRQFASLTDFYDRKLGVEKNWFELLVDMRRDALKSHEKYRGKLPYHALISEEDLAEDAYLYMLDHADYASFYVGHTGGAPPPKIPRYEFLCSLREMDTDGATHYVQRATRQLATALLTCSFSEDRDHNFLSRLTLVKIIPSVVYQAHEWAKHWGKKLEGEFKSIVVKRLSEKRKQQVEERDVNIQPIGIRQYLQRFANARKALPPSDRGLDSH